VRSLSEQDASALLAFVSDLADFDEPLAFPPRLLARLQDLIAADEVAYSELDPIERDLILGVSHRPDGEDYVVREDDQTEEAAKGGLSLWWDLRHTHPSCSYRTRTGDWTTARKVSDFVTLREFRRTPIYDVFYRGELDYWLDVGLAASPARTRLFMFLRKGGPDFNERDRLVAQLVQPHLAERAEAVEAALRAAEALGAIEDGTIEEAHRIMLCSGTGVIEFGSASSRAVLERYMELDNGRVPSSILARRELTLRNGRRSLQVRVAKTDTLYVLLLEERDLRVEKLTAREHQVLERVVVGMGNEAIALELGIAPGTVAKHLEHAYRKLGVQNRTAASRLLSNN
jgi:DNA-binding CsgD family transcriptional regulator